MKNKRICKTLSALCLTMVVAFGFTIIIAAITSVSKKSRKFPTHYHLNDRCGLVKPSVVMLEQIRTIDKSRLKNYIGHLNKDDMENINKTLLCSLGIT